MVQPKKADVNQHEMPVVLQNLPPAETLNQMVDNLNFLALVMDEAFSSIQSQISAEQSKISNIQDRVSKASKQTDLIAKYPNKATTVYSSSVFPSSVNKDNLAVDETLVNVLNRTNDIPRPKYKLSVEQRLERAPITDTLKLFHRLSNRTKYKPNNVIRGLGNLPSRISSVSDCLLFNTDENPYVKYESLDNLQGIMKPVDINNINNNGDIDGLQLVDAPKTIKEKNRLMDGDTYDIAYKPEMGEVPRFSVTTTLSGLGGLALDIGWQGTKSSKQRIAPSSVAFQDLPELHVQPDMLPGFDELDDTPFGDFGDVNIAPPPAPTPVINNNNNNNNNIQQGAPPAAPAPNPNMNNNIPQAPTMPVAPEIHVQPNDIGAEYRNPNTAPQAPQAPAAPARQASPAPSSDGGGGGRGGLLAAIRAGKKLKNSKSERKVSKKAAPAKPKTLSLMDHLKMKLQARNKVMRGETDNTGGSGGGSGGDAPGLSLKMNKDEKERDDLGISGVPDTMRMAMHFSDDEQSSAVDEDWNDD